MKINAINVNLPRINDIKGKERTTPVSFAGAEDSFSKVRNIIPFEDAKSKITSFFEPSFRKIIDTFETDSFAETTKKAAEFVRSDRTAMIRIGSVARQLNGAEEESALATPIGKAVKAVKKIYKKMTLDMCAHEYSAHDRHCTAVFSKQSPETAKRFLDFSEFYEDMDGIFSLLRGDSDAFFNSSFRADREILKDKFSTNEEFQYAIGERLQAGAEKFQKTGRKTVLTVEGIEKLLRPDTNSRKNIAKMKEVMQKTDSAYATQLRFTASEHKALDAGIGGTNRIVSRTEIDKLGITRDAVIELDCTHDLLQPVIDEVRKIYSESPGIQERAAKQAKIENILQERNGYYAELRTLYTDPEANGSKIEEFLSRFKLPEEEVKDKVDEAAEIITKKTSKVKPVVIALGAAAIIGGGIYIMKKKGISFKSQKKESSSQEKNVQTEKTVSGEEQNKVKFQNAYYPTSVKSNVPEIFKAMG